MATIRDRAGNVLVSGALPTPIAEVLACIPSGTSLANADLRGLVFDGLDLSGLQAPGADFTDCSMRNITANRLVLGQPLQLSAASLQGAVITGTLTHADLSCTHPTAMRAELGPNTRIRGCDFSDCPDVLDLGLDPQRGRVVACRNGSGWKVHAGSDNAGNHVMTEAQARTTLGSDPRYAAKLAWLDSQEGRAAKAAIDARPVGSGQPVRPAPGGAGQVGTKEASER